MSKSSMTKTYHHKPYPAINPTNPDLSVKGKVVVVTGGGRGIGRAIGLAFAQAGAQVVVLIGRSETSLQLAAREISSAYQATKAATYAVDVTDAGRVKAAFEEIKASFGGVDVLVLCPGYLSEMNLIHETDPDDWWKGYEINVKSVFVTTQAFLRTAKAGATLINVSSGSAHAGYVRGHTGYASSKAAGVRFVQDLAVERPEFRVFNIQPGVVETDLAKQAGRAGEDDPGLPAGFCVWLASSASEPFRGRFLWANWDVTELLQRAKEIQEKDLLKFGLKGWGYDVV